ncbi:Crp/Fnr family transcriptional regulator [Nonomuraea jabiensis]|uniref:CRP-like cAMP-binding protein n=1 Tax=Nonomuraea jabiensis TaxID=882448 RepID=A0A7W9LH33_9ACTN|nr:Crp/Fnr family transcriptional regulator [Nonomuraea jabiensis]MBB5783550.1 CRP-like cAMP-binding protein [Nonomuraea jabiensis]
MTLAERHAEALQHALVGAWGARQGSFWAELDSDGRRKLLGYVAGGRGSLRWYSGEHDMMYQEGHTDTHAVILLAGHVKVTVDKPAGEDSLLVIRYPGQILGEDKALRRDLFRAGKSDPDGYVRRNETTVRTVTVQPLEWALGLAIPSSGLEMFLMMHPGAWAALATDLRSRLDEAETRIGEKIADRRLAKALASMIDYEMALHEGKRKIKLSLTQRELASWIGVSKETVERILHIWRRREIVETGYRTITVLRPDELLRIANVRSSYDPSQWSLGTA